MTFASSCLQARDCSDVRVISARLACMTSCFLYCFRCISDFNHRSATSCLSCQLLVTLRLNSLITLHQSVRFDCGFGRSSWHSMNSKCSAGLSTGSAGVSGLHCSLVQSIMFKASCSKHHGTILLMCPSVVSYLLSLTSSTCRS